MEKTIKIKLSDVMKSRVLDLYHKKMNMMKDIIQYIDSHNIKNKTITMLDIRNNIEKYLISEGEYANTEKINAIMEIYNDILSQCINHEIDIDDIFYLESTNLRLTKYEINSLQKVNSTKYALDILILEFSMPVYNVESIKSIIFDIRENGYISGIALIDDTAKFQSSKRINNNFLYIRTISIIKSSHNHSTLKHKINNVTVLIDYNDGNKIKPLKFNIHYCENCKTFFDFHDSFYSQYKFIDYNNLIININEVQNDQPINGNYISELEKSLLSKLGYKVGKSGLIEKERQRILSYAIESGLLSVSEVKSHLEFCIIFFKNKKNMSTSISHWQDDMFFISRNQNKFNYSKKKY